ncbi:uncharacterized protein PV07_02947 [Cladophialophora immunda]|uniref:Heterokaryon incompatibility domain-containing protein n=1 Tax=Cladophialophora immunda TaxID=569365 RepID=A0A0D2B0Z9_9EURO|nr:uncharacterized protein PV07_02947 [Cladophialophora immunda]KIW31287.1 hypothetical protein PV07_02947 [Cladophialophora immunda]
MRRTFGLFQRVARSVNGQAETGQNSFTYTPLHEADEIRLLYLAPRNVPSSSVRDAIQHVFLSTAPLYTAVSWMWGALSDLVEFQVDGQTIMIPQNLLRVIEQLRAESQPRRIWIDAICIDQKSLQERNHQVQMMGQIYRNANYVVACLTAKGSSDRRRLKREAEQLHKLLQEGRHSTDTSRYRHFFGNQYFTRRWIIQEVAQAQQVKFCCEGYLLPMDILRDAINDSILKAKGNKTEGYAYFSEAQLVAERRAIQLCSTDSRSPTSAMSLEALLYRHEAAQCRDFHDKVYALISLSQEAQAHLIVQYDIDQATLMLKVLEFCYRYEKLSNFRILSFMSFLRQHLEVGIGVLRSRSFGPQSPVITTEFVVRGTVRGRISELAPGRGAEDAALGVRNKLPTLLLRHGLLIKKQGHFMTLEDADASADTNNHTVMEVSGLDQCLFSFTGSNHRDRPLNAVDDDDSAHTLSPDPPGYSLTQEPLLVGFASTRVRIGDEIWQFDRTPVAIIARKTPPGFSLAGRAILLRDPGAANMEGHQWHLEDEIAWIKDGTKYPQSTPVIKVDLRGLYKLMTRRRARDQQHGLDGGDGNRYLDIDIDKDTDIDIDILIDNNIDDKRAITRSRDGDTTVFAASDCSSAASTCVFADPITFTAAPSTYMFSGKGHWNILGQLDCAIDGAHTYAQCAWTMGSYPSTEMANLANSWVTTSAASSVTISPTIYAEGDGVSSSGFVGVAYTSKYLITNYTTSHVTSYSTYYVTNYMTTWVDGGATICAGLSSIRASIVAVIAVLLIITLL